MARDFADVRRGVLVRENMAKGRGNDACLTHLRSKMTTYVRLQIN